MNFSNLSSSGDQSAYQKVNVLGVSFITAKFSQTVNWLKTIVIQGKKAFVITANPEVVMMARANPEFNRVVQRADIVTPDGIGVVIASKLLVRQNGGTDIPERVPGYDLLQALMQVADQQGWRVYLLGASPESNLGATNRLHEWYPNAQIVGNRDGYFSPEDEATIVEEINTALPHLLFVALGVPRQEMWIANHWERLNANVVMSVGGSFDGIAGKVKRAPQIWQKLNLEWLYRLLSQPSRWRRQLALPHFVLLVLKERFFPKRR